MEEKQKKEAKTRTSITIDPSVLEAARRHCEAERISVSSFIETCVQNALGPQPVTMTEETV
ncbi:MAG TPA: hypothetical protein VIL29_00635 [Pseudothermotoga sp.]